MEGFNKEESLSSSGRKDAFVTLAPVTKRMFPSATRSSKHTVSQLAAPALNATVNLDPFGGFNPIDIPNALCVIPQRLYWVASDKIPVHSPSNAKVFYAQLDKGFEYISFHCDFGPLDLGQTWRYCQTLEVLLSLRSLEDHVIVHRAPQRDAALKANAAYLISAFCVIYLLETAEEAFSRFETTKLCPFRDASWGDCSYNLTILDCLKGLERAMKVSEIRTTQRRSPQNGWFSYKQFNIEQYEYYEQVTNGDLNWIIPGEIVAFSGPPADEAALIANRLKPNDCMTPERYVSILKSLKVNLVIRLNKKQYNPAAFVRAGIKHVELYFVDGSCPSR